MSRLQSIENSLKSINDAVFQELCDSYLIRRNGKYASFRRVGSASGKQKTTKGTPDTLVLLADGSYLFVECSTNEALGYKKLKEDIEKCIDPTKSGIQPTSIAEIILCMNFNLKSAEVEELVRKLRPLRIPLYIYNLDALSLELHLDHRDLVHQYLHFPIDTGQVVSLPKFIEEYHKASSGIATPLTNTFLHREKELNDLKAAMHAYDVVILTGLAGVGKTKLTLEAINSFTADNIHFNAFAISYKNHTLIEDLGQYLTKDKDYILFVDDANRIDAFSQVVGFYKERRTGKLKIIITVRDYAFEEINLLCNGLQLTTLSLTKMTDEELKPIISMKPFEVTNPSYQDKILGIADGNPRLAIMAAMLAIDKQDLDALNNASDLFEKYYSTFVRDNGEFANKTHIKSLGIVAFFFALQYDRKDVLEPILNNFGVSYSDFIDSIDRLERLELVDIQFDFVKIPEQNLSTYFFYRAFIKDELLSFRTLLSAYFRSNQNRFVECVVSSSRNFGYESVMTKVKPWLTEHLHSIQHFPELTFKFLASFWFYLPLETLDFLLNQITKMPKVSVDQYPVKADRNAFSFDKNETIELFGEFFHHATNHLSDALSLGFEFARKSPENLPELLHKIRERLSIERDDDFTGFYRQHTLVDILIKGLTVGDPLLSTCFYELARTFLGFRFTYATGGRHHTIHLITVGIPNSDHIQRLRRNIWEAIELNHAKFPAETRAILAAYTESGPDVIHEVATFDLTYVVKIIGSCLTKNSFEDCRLVYQLVRWFERHSILHPDFSSLKLTFTNHRYEAYLKIDWHRLRDKEVFDFLDNDEYEKLKEADIRESFTFSSSKLAKDFYEDFAYIRKASRDNWSYNRAMDIVLDENLQKDLDTGISILERIIEGNNEIGFVPRSSFQNILNSRINEERIWQLLSRSVFRDRTLWQLSFFGNLDSSLVSPEHATRILDMVKDMEADGVVYFRDLQKYLAVDPGLFRAITQIVVEKNKAGLKIALWHELFDIYFKELGNDVSLIKEAYMQQENIQAHFDSDGEGFLNVLQADKHFLIEYIDNLQSKAERGLTPIKEDLSNVWQIQGIENELFLIFDRISATEPYLGIGDHFCNCFFKTLKDEFKARATQFLLRYLEHNFKDSNKVNIVVDVTRNSLRWLYEEMVIKHLTLSQDVKLFKSVRWRGNGGQMHSGSLNMGDLRASEWRNLLSIVEKSGIGLDLIPIKRYISEEIDLSIRIGDSERQRRFLER
jgi:hypothetical protein